MVEQVKGMMGEQGKRGDGGTRSRWKTIVGGGVCV